MPAHAWDSHMHVTSPECPLAPDASYVPGEHNITQAINFEGTIGIHNIVIIQPSIYGNDNTCLLNGLTALGTEHGRGVVGIDPDTIDSPTLEKWHKLGIRGARLNLKSTNSNITEASLRKTLQSYAKTINSLNWVLEIYIGMEDIPLLERASQDLGLQLSIAHFGAPTLPPPDQRQYPLDPYSIAGFQSLVNLLKARNTYVKFSGAYRSDTDPEIRGIEAIAKELLKFAGDRIVFASDWPHTRFEGLDIKPFVDKVLTWTEEVGLTEKVFTLNAKKLWDVDC